MAAQSQRRDRLNGILSGMTILLILIDLGAVVAIVTMLTAIGL